MIALHVVAARGVFGGSGVGAVLRVGVSSEGIQSEERIMRDDSHALEGTDLCGR